MNQLKALSPSYSIWTDVLKRSLLLWNKPIYAGIVTALIFLGITSLAGVPWRSSPFLYFNYLADAFLHGQLYLRLIPPVTLDLSLFDGKYFLYWGPLPAIIAMPLVALFGVQVSDILQCITFGSFNVALLSLLVNKLSNRGFISLTPEKSAFLVVFFSLGTMQAPLLAVGNAYYLGQVESVTFALLAFLAAFSLKGWKAFFWTSWAMAGVLTTRSSAIFIAIFLGWYLLHSHWSSGIRKIVTYCFIGMAPFLFVFSLTLLYNLLRFGNAFENGLTYQMMGGKFMEMIGQYGIFSLHYVPMNFVANYIKYPLLDLVNKVIVPKGGSLFLLSPLFFASLYTLWKDRRDVDTWFLFAAVVIGNIPVLMIVGPESIHFGPRYLLDVVVPLLLLTARGMSRWSDRLILCLVSISVIHYLFGSLGMVFG